MPENCVVFCVYPTVLLLQYSPFKVTPTHPLHISMDQIQCKDMNKRGIKLMFQTHMSANGGEDTFAVYDIQYT